MIGYYVHHLGRGHLMRASAVARRSGVPVTGLSSLARPDDWPGGWIALPMDDGPPLAAPTRDGVWHWLPRAHAGLGRRMRAIAGWATSARPALLVSDVSVEVLVLAALLGVRTGGVVLHGRRDDPPHRLGFATADLLVGPWPGSHVQAWHAAHAPSLVATGAFGPDDGRDRSALVPRRVVVMAGAGPHAIRPDEVGEAAAATPSWDWHAVGLGDDGPRGVEWRGWLDDPWPLVSSAEVVVSTAGDGSVAQIAAARRPAVLIPQDRPFDEQRDLGRCIGAMSPPPALVVERWPAAAGWERLLAAARGLDGERWTDYLDGHGADRFAALLEEAAA